MNKLKQWILNREFVKGKIKAEIDSTRMLAFKYARADFDETMTETQNDKVEELASKKLNDLLSPVDLLNVVSIDKAKGLLFVGGTRADDLTLSNLKAEAEFLANSTIWKLIQETPKELAQRAMFVAGDGSNVITQGRSMLYTLSTQKNIVDVIKSYISRK